MSRSPQALANFVTRRSARTTGSNGGSQNPPVPTIPSPNQENMLDVLNALKNAVETLQGTVGGQPVTRTFVSNDQPTATNVGDVWVVANTGKVAYWDGNQWLNATV